ncbi:MAG: hypothetical protein L3J79_06625, partial [Candidatus Marinimicrobia bacterium]|nr:hypothetical protein [Candidatus Neomarinimicrobiota bacterium]
MPFSIHGDKIEPRGIDRAAKDFPKEPLGEEVTPIDALKPGTKLHTEVLSNLLEKIRESETEMSKFYARWTYNERRVQAYINLPDYQKLIQAQNDSGAPAKTVNIVVPHIFSTVQTVVTFLMHVVTSRRPIFQVTSKQKEAIEAAGMIETLLQYNADHERMVKKLHNFFMDGEIYGLAVLAPRWEETKALRTVWKTGSEGFGLGRLRVGVQASHAVVEERIIYQGNTLENIDPTFFLPDPSVPMTEVNKEGEYVFTYSYKGTHYLKAKEQAGLFKWVDAVGDGSYAAHGDRGLRAGGASHAGGD